VPRHITDTSHIYHRHVRTIETIIPGLHNTPGPANGPPVPTYVTPPPTLTQPNVFSPLREEKMGNTIYIYNIICFLLPFLRSHSPIRNFSLIGPASLPNLCPLPHLRPHAASVPRGCHSGPPGPADGYAQTPFGCFGSSNMSATYTVLDSIVQIPVVGRSFPGAARNRVETNRRTTAIPRAHNPIPAPHIRPPSIHAATHPTHPQQPTPPHARQPMPAQLIAHNTDLTTPQQCDTILMLALC